MRGQVQVGQLFLRLARRHFNIGYVTCMPEAICIYKSACMDPDTDLYGRHGLSCRMKFGASSGENNVSTGSTRENSSLFSSQCRESTQKISIAPRPHR